MAIIFMAALVGITVAGTGLFLLLILRTVREIQRIRNGINRPRPRKREP